MPVCGFRGKRMADVSSLAGDIAAAGAALAGLTLVFMGHANAAYHSHPDKPVVRETYHARTWWAFRGFVLSLLATFFSLIGKWLSPEGNDQTYLISLGGLLLIAALVVVIFAAFETVRSKSWPEPKT